MLRREIVSLKSKIVEITEEHKIDMSLNTKTMNSIVKMHEKALDDKTSELAGIRQELQTVKFCEQLQKIEDLERNESTMSNCEDCFKKSNLPSNKAQFTVEVSNKSFAKKSGLNHCKVGDQLVLAAHSQNKQEKSHQCKFENCGKVFTRKNGLNLHMNRHTGKKPFKCKSKDCKKWFADSGTRDRHSKRVCNITVTRT